MSESAPSLKFPVSASSSSSTLSPSSAHQTKLTKSSNSPSSAVYGSSSSNSGSVEPLSSPQSPGFRSKKLKKRYLPSAGPSLSSKSKASSHEVPSFSKPL